MLPKAAAHASIKAQPSARLDLSHRMHARPELGFEAKRAGAAAPDGDR